METKKWLIWGGVILLVIILIVFLAKTAGNAAKKKQDEADAFEEEQEELSSDPVIVNAGACRKLCRQKCRASNSGFLNLGIFSGRQQCKNNCKADCFTHGIEYVKANY